MIGENGLLTKAGNAQKETLNSENEEKLQVEVLGSYNKRGKIDTNQLRTNLQHISGITTENDDTITDSTTIELPMIVKIDGNQYLIKEDGKTRAKYGIDEYDLERNPETYYGSYVTNYNSPYDIGIDLEGQAGKWQIFMADEDNIYLISSNYITRKYTGTKNNVGFGYDTTKYTEETATQMNFLSISSEYNANSNTTEIPDILSKLNKPSIYHIWMNTPENQIRNLAGEKAIASILDTNVWKDYNNTIYAQYTIGGPSLEMFCKAYNDSHVGENLEYEVVNGTDRLYGYRMRKGTAGDYSYSVGGLKTNAISEKVDGMFFKSTAKDSRYYIASPSIAGYYHRILFIYSAGSVSREFYQNNTASFRPLVCLKSNIHLVKNEDEETYSLEVD